MNKGVRTWAMVTAIAIGGYVTTATASEPTADEYWAWVSSRHSAQAYRNFVYYFPEDARRAQAEKAWETLEYAELVGNAQRISPSSASHKKAMELYWLFRIHHPNSTIAPPEEIPPVTSTQVERARLQSLVSWEENPMAQQCLDILRQEEQNSEAPWKAHLLALRTLIEWGGKEYILPYLEIRVEPEYDQVAGSFCHPDAITELMEIYVSKRPRPYFHDGKTLPELFVTAGNLLGRIPSPAVSTYLFNQVSEDQAWAFDGIWRFPSSNVVDVLTKAMNSQNPIIAQKAASDAVVFLDEISTNTLWDVFSARPSGMSPPVDNRQQDPVGLALGTLLCMKGDTRLLVTGSKGSLGWLEWIQSPEYFGTNISAFLAKRLEHTPVQDLEAIKTLRYGLKSAAHPAYAKTHWKLALSLSSEKTNAEADMYGFSNQFLGCGDWYGPHLTPMVVSVLETCQSDRQRRELIRLLADIGDNVALDYLVALAHKPARPLTPVGQGGRRARDLSEREFIITLMMKKEHSKSVDNFLQSCLETPFDRNFMISNLRLAPAGALWPNVLFAMAEEDKGIRTTIMTNTVFFGPNYKWSPNFGYVLPKENGVRWTREFVDNLRKKRYVPGLQSDSGGATSWPLERAIFYWGTLGDCTLIDVIRKEFVEFSSDRKVGKSFETSVLQALESIVLSTSKKALVPFLNDQHEGFRKIAVAAYAEAMLRYQSRLSSLVLDSGQVESVAVPSLPGKSDLLAQMKAAGSRAGTGDAAALETVKAGMRNAQIDIQIAAIEGFAQAAEKKPVVIENLKEVLAETRSDTIKLKLVGELAKMQDSNALVEIKKFIKSEDPVERMYAATVLGSGAQDVPEELVAALDDSDPGVRVHAAAAILRLLSAKAVAGHDAEDKNTQTSGGVIIKSREGSK